MSNAEPGQRVHGTPGGWARHTLLKTPPCGPCRRAHGRDNDRRKRAGKCATGLGWPLLPGARRG